MSASDELIAGLVACRIHSADQLEEQRVGLRLTWCRGPAPRRLDPQRVLIPGERVLPAHCASPTIARGGRAGIALRVMALEGLIDLVDIIGDAWA